MKTKFYSISGAVSLLVLIFLLSAAFIKRQKVLQAQTKTVVMKKQYVCSMHPQVIQDFPGDCPICGMSLIEKVDQDKNNFDTVLSDVVLSVNKSVIASVSTVTPEKSVLPHIIEASGIINYDPRKIQTVSARFGGLIERSFVKYQFQHIKRGQKIYEIYSPDMYNDRWNYVKLIQAYPDSDDLTAEALEWLNLLGLSQGQIDSLKHSVKPDFHLPVYSYVEGEAVSVNFEPENFFFTGVGEGKISETTLAGKGSIDLNDGINIEAGDALFKVIDVHALRLDLKVKTEDGSLLKTGQTVFFSDIADPDIQFKASISQIEPLNSGLFQIVKVYFSDKDKRLLPGRQIKAQIITEPRECLWVPVTSVIDLGERRLVFVMQGNKFITAEVKTGARSENRIEIISGIDQNVRIAEKPLLLTDSDGFINAN